ncbi:MAG TPA: Na+/H+ antiporter NhaC [Longimicrobiales bacterium]
MSARRDAMDGPDPHARRDAPNAHDVAGFDAGTGPRRATDGHAALEPREPMDHHAPHAPAAVRDAPGADAAEAAAATQLSLFEALLPIAAMVLFFILGTVLLGGGQELLVAVLLGAATVAGIVAVRRGHSWDDIQRATGEKLAGVLPAVLILLSIGVLISMWVLSGTIPYLVYWGVRLVSPGMLVLTAFLVTALMSTFTGTSWGSAGTIGVALMGTAAALDAPLAATAGAVVSGAYFGDKLSPLSDSTNIASIGAGAPLYSHIRHLMHTSVPSALAALATYAVAARLAPVPTGELADGARALLADLDAVFRLHWIVLLPPAVVVFCIARRVPPTLAILLSSLVAAAIGIFVQPFAVGDAITAAVAGFRMSIVAAAGVDPATLGADFTNLVERGGLYSMANTLIVILSAFLLTGAMEVSGALDTLIGRMLAAVRSVFGLIAATMAAGATMIGLTSHGGVTSLVIGGLFQRAYADRGLAPENLSRSIEDSVTITEPLMPWTVSAVYMAQTLGVPTVDYAPWAVFCYGGPFFSLLIARLYRRTGYGLKPLAQEVAPATATTTAPARV